MYKNINILIVLLKKNWYILYVVAVWFYILHLIVISQNSYNC